tara:strand:- start:337 stop:870 length:534 start_codon:yes stop_codon:yes gene_type:complete
MAEKPNQEQTPKKPEECHDLSNLKYKTLLANGKKNAFPTHKKVDASKIEAILENEMNTQKKLSWSRLDRIDKIQKLCSYAEKYCKENALGGVDLSTMKTYLTAAVNRNRLHKVREVKYNKDTGEVECIPQLLFNKLSRKFTLKRGDKRISTLSSLGAGTNTTTRKKRSSKKNGTDDN